MTAGFNLTHILHYFLKREATQFFASIAIRNLGLGMILIFEPIYIYLYFGRSLSLTMLFFGSVYGLYGLIAVFGAKIMSKIGSKHTILISHFVFLGYYLCLFFLPSFSLLILAAIIARGIGMTLFWPCFHVDFCRFSQTNHQSIEVGKLNAVYFAPTIISPIIGGWILSSFGYSALFFAVMGVLLTSAIPMFLSRETHIAYTDSVASAWRGIFKRSNRKINAAFIFYNLEAGVDLYIWPIFMAVLAISYSSMGGIVTFSLVISTFFMLYMGRASERLVDRIRFLNIGSFLTSMAWILKYFVATPFTAFLAHAAYRLCRTTAAIPFQSLLYEKASLKGSKMDEFLVCKEILINISRCLFFFILAGFFLFVNQVNAVFFIAAALSLGFVFLGIPPKFMWSSSDDK